MHQIGVGVLGPVYRTYEPAADRLVAVKVFDLDLTPEKVQALVDALNSLVASDLSHRGIVSPLAAGLEDETPYLAQEYVAAESLDVAVRHYSPAPLDTVLPFITGIAEAVDAAHERGIVHGALHLRDVFVSPEEVRITGFGVLSVLEAVGLAVPIRRPYTAPEVIAGRAWGGEADLYAMAAVAYELLTGRRAAGSGEQVTDRLRDVAGVADSDALHAAFVTALADAPEERFSSGARFVSALRSAMGAADHPTEPPSVPSSSAAVPDLLAGLDIRDVDSPEDSNPSLGDPAAAATPLDDAVSDVETAPNDETETARPAEPDEPDDRVESGEFEPVGEFEEDGDGVGADFIEAARSDDYVPLDVPPAESGALEAEDDLDERPAVSSLASSVPGESPDATEGLDDWETEDPNHSDASNDGVEFGADGVDDAGEQESYGLGVDDDDLDGDDADDQDDAEAVPFLVGGSQEASWVRGVAPLAAIVLVIGLVVGALAYYVGLGFRSEEAPSDRVLGQEGSVDAAAVPADSPSVEPATVEALPERAPTVPPAAPAPESATPAPEPPAPAPEPAIPDQLVAATASPSSPPAAARVTPAPPRSPDGGWLLFRTDPPGATVLLNGTVRGVTPLSLRDVPFGQHEIEVRREGFAPATREVDVRPADPVVPVALSLSRLDDTTAQVTEDIGSLLVESRPPGASVVVDGEMAGVTPVVVPVSRGPHRVRMERNGYQVWAKTVEVASAERVRVAASLERMPQ